MSDEWNPAEIIGRRRRARRPFQGPGIPGIVVRDRATRHADHDIEQQEYEAWAEDKIRKVSPLGRWQTPTEFAAMAVFLASDHAQNITGQTINIDGGQVMHA